MTQFGQSLPALPQIYRDLNTYSFTKAGFLSHLVRALVTVGMKPLQQSWPWDPIADPEAVIADPTVAVFPFDYPDTSTFEFNNQLWRPCVMLCVWVGNTSVSTSTNLAHNYMLMVDAIRPNGAFNINTVQTAERERTPAATNFGFGGGGAVFTTVHPDVQGGEVFVANWKPYASFAGNDQTMLGVAHFFTYLGPAGLFVYVGTGTTYNTFGDVMAVGFGFGGGRIPGREAIPDVDLNHICPVFPMFTRASGSGSDMYDTATGRLRTLIHGIQYLGKAQQFPVRAFIFNLENLERPVFSELTPFSAPSPRAVSGGGAAHILGRIVIVPNDKENNTGDFYSRLESSLTTGEVRPLWSEVYTCPSLRFADRSAPLGDHEDPVTLTNWWLTPHYATSALLALKAENVVLVSALSSGSLTLVGENYYNMIGTPNPGTAFTFPNISGGAIAPVVTVTNTLLAALAWDATLNGAEDVVRSTTAGASTTNNTIMDWVAQQAGADADDTVYKITFQWRNQLGVSTVGGNRVEFSRYFQGAFVLLGSLVSAGTNTGAAEYNYQTATFSLTLDSTVTSQKNLRFRWQAFKNLAANGNVVSVKDVRVQKYRYL